MSEIINNKEQEEKKTDINDSEKTFLQIIEKKFPENKETLIQQRQVLLEKNNDIQENLEPFINKLMLCYDDITITKNDIKNNIFEATNNILSQDIYKDKPLLKKFLLQDKNIYIFRDKIIDISTKDKAVETKDKAVETKDKANELRSKLEEKYITIEPQYKHNTKEELDTFKNQPKFEDIIKKLPEERQEIYFGYRFAAEKIAEEAKKNNIISEKHISFIQQFNKLDQELNLNSQIDISSIPREKIKQKYSLNTINDIITNDKIGEDLVANNKSMQKFVTGETDNIETKNKETMFPLKTIKTKITERYADEVENTLDDLLKNNNLNQYKDQFNPDGSIKDMKNIAKADAENIQKISEAIDKKITTIAQQEQERLFQETNEVIKTKAVEALVKNIGQYFQITSFQRGNLAEQCNIDAKNGIEFDENMLKLSANMDGKDIGFYYDMKNGEVRADDFIAFEGIEEAKGDGIYHINRDQDKKGREQLPIKMQTLDQIMANSTSAIIDNSEKTLQESKQPEVYRNILSDNTNIFLPKESSLGKDIIEHTMEKNTAVQNAHEFVTKYIPTKNTYNQKTEKYEYNIYNIINTTFNRYTAEEIRIRNNLFQRFQNRINQKNPNFEDKMISTLFDKTTARKQQRGEYDKEKGPNIYQFMQGLTYEGGSTIKEKVINLKLFSKIVNELEKESGTTKNIKESKKYQKLWNDIEEKKEQENIDNELEQQLATI